MDGGRHQDAGWNRFAIQWSSTAAARWWRRWWQQPAWSERARTGIARRTTRSVRGSAVGASPQTQGRLARVGRSRSAAARPGDQFRDTAGTWREPYRRGDFQPARTYAG